MLHDASGELNKVLDLVITHTLWRKCECINLIASENVMSPLAMILYMNDMMHRYAEGKPFKRYYQGLVYVDELEVKTQEIIGSLLDTRYVELRPISGTIANATVFKSLASYGDKAVVVPVQAGAHVSHTRYGTLGALGIEQIEMPFNLEEWNIDVDGAVKLIEEVGPKLVILGGSLYIFPHPVREIAEAVHSVGAKLVYDAAHVLGLITGKVWDNPLKQGADILTSSTHKTFPGPQGGLIATVSKDDYKKIGKVVFPMFVSNHHLHRLAALAVTGIEMKLYGRKYAEQIVKNAKVFAQALAENGFKVIAENKGFTESHQVIIDVKEYGGGAKNAELLERANIIVNKNLLPWDKPEDIKNPSGIRLGVQEVTRWGMREEEMKAIAEFMRKIVIDKKDPGDVKREVIEFRKNYLEVQYAIKISPEEEEKLFKLILHPYTSMSRM